MVSLAQLWLPILLSAVFVFFASSLFNMMLKFWHMADYKGFSNEDEVRAAVRQGAPQPGMYSLPYCTPERMRDPAMHEKFKEGPIAHIMVRPSGPMTILPYLAQWFVFCVLISFLCALLASLALTRGAEHHQVFHFFAIATVLGHCSGSFTNAIWWGHPKASAAKYIVDGIVYALITAATFSWLWPA